MLHSRDFCLPTICVCLRNDILLTRHIAKFCVLDTIDYSELAQIASIIFHRCDEIQNRHTRLRSNAFLYKVGVYHYYVFIIDNANFRKVHLPSVIIIKKNSINKDRSEK